MRKGKISAAVIRRLPRYYRTLDTLHQSGTVRISSSALGQHMGITASQIRQDLSCFGEFGQQGYGYNVEDLRREIAEILGMDSNYTAVLVGAGNLGRALIRNFAFKNNGFTLSAAFDSNPKTAGQTFNDVPVLPDTEMDEYLRSRQVQVGVLTVPGYAAQAMADKLIAGGVKGIWNFTNTEVSVGDSGVIVENVHFSDSLLTLSYYITESNGPADED
jgi:redox-sensing transcriptional repressor